VIKISRVAQRYSTSLFEVANSLQLLDQIQADLNAVGELMSTSPQILHALANPTIPRQEIEDALRALAEKLGLQTVTTNFLCILAQRRRGNLIPEILEDFAGLVRAKHNQLQVDLTSRSPLNKNQLTKMEQALAAKTGKEILLNVNIDDSILGGIIVNYGSYKLDFSLKSKLNELKHALERLG
jgi:F-type H+-transporting ATPase subunit delta